MLFVSLTVVITALVCSGCSEKNIADNSKETDTKRPTEHPVPSEALPKGDPNHPLADYKEILSNNDVMFTYYALSTEPTDYTKVLNNYSPEYWSTSDQFKKRDLTASLKPEADQEILARKEARHIKLKVNATWKVKKYDFEKKGFPQTAITNQTRFGWDSKEWINSNKIALSYFIAFTNDDHFKILKVEDEQVARVIEQKLKEDLSFIVYGFVQKADPKEPLLWMQVLKISLLDNNGVEMLSRTYGE